MDTNQIKHRRLERIGFVVVCICAMLFHFTYEFSGENYFVGLISAVNESVWEHTKIVYFPFLFYAIIEYFILKPPFKRFFISKTIALAFITVVMISFFYTYSGIIGTEYLIVDIIFTFILSALAFLVSYKVFYSERNLEKYIVLFAMLFVGQLLMEILFTPFPPDLPLFMDSETGVYGFG